MKPILFDKSATAFTTNGIGRLDCIECLVTEERNGQYELEMSISQEAQFASEIGMNSIIVVRPCVGGSLQAFRVYDIEKFIDGKFTVYANHISYQLNYIPTMPFSEPASASACTNVLAKLKQNAVELCPFTFSTDVSVVASYNQRVPMPIRQCLGGVEGSVLDQYGGEYEFDNYSVILHRNRGRQTPEVTLRYGKDITDFEQEEHITATVTGVVPYWVDSEGEEIVILDEKVVDSQYADRYPFKRTIPIDFSGDFQDKPTQAQLRDHARAYVNEAGLGIPKVGMKISFIDLSQTMEYKDLILLQSVKLCDVIGIHFDALDIDTTAKIVKTVYDVLNERYDSIEVGTSRTNLSNVINDVNASVTSLADRTRTDFKKSASETDDKLDNLADVLQDDIDNATAWLTSSGGYVVAVKNNDGSWKELLFLDHNDPAQAVNVLRINENGIGFSSNGVNGTYQQAWTLDGRLVIGGTNVPSITVYDNNQDVIFRASADAMIWNATNSSMNSAGIITAYGAVLDLAEITNATIDDATITDCLISGGSLVNASNAGWTKISGGRIHGGDANTVDEVASNASHIYFDGTVDGSTGVLSTQSKYLDLWCDKLFIHNTKLSSNAYEGYNGTLATKLTLTYVASPNDLQIGNGNYVTYNDILYGCTLVDQDGFFKITAYNTFNLTVPDYWDINGSTTTTESGTRRCYHGIVT